MIAAARGVAALSLAAVLAGCEGTTAAAPTAPVDSGTLPANYTVELDPLFATPRWIENRDTPPVARSSQRGAFSDRAAFEIVRGFVLEHSGLFRLRPGIDDFVPTWASSSDGVNLVKIRQTYRGIPIDVMGYGTSVLPSGAVGSMIGRFMPDIQLDIFLGVGAETAAARAIASFTTTPVSLGRDPTLTIITDSAPRLTWWVIVRAGDFRSWTVVVDAGDGTVLRTMQNWIDG